MSLGKRLFIGEAAADAACPTDSVQPFGADSAYSSNVALYEFENNANDTVGNHNATSSSNFSTDSKFGTYSFDVTSSSSFDTGISNSELPVSGSWTCSAWVKPTGFSTNRAPISFTSWTTNYGWSLWVSTSGIAYPRVGTSLQGSGFSLTLNNWHHIVLTYDSSVLKFYVDKNLISQHTVTIASPNTNLRFGKSNLIFPTGNFGKLDQVRLYDKALSLNEVEILYNETTSTASDTNVLGEGSGVALYSLDHDASDASGNYDGVPTDVTFGVDGQINYGAGFNGSSSRIQIASTATAPLNVSSGNFSISMWVNPSNLTNNNKLIYKWGASASLQNWLATITTSGVLYVVEGTAVGNTLMTGTTTIPINAWTHIAITRAQGGNLVQYINGVATNTFSTANRSLKTSTEPLYIGYQAGQSTNFTGSIDQVRIFNKTLSSSEVSTLYAETACVYTSTTDTIDYQGTNIAYYKLDGNALDETSNNHDGAESNITYEFGRYGTAAVFNGSSSNIEIGDNITSDISSSNNSFTVSLWLKMDSSPSTNTTAFSFQKTIWFDMFVPADNLLNVRLIESVSSNRSETSIQNPLVNGTWNNIVFVADETNSVTKLYLNGQFQQSDSWNGTFFDRAQGNYIGSYGTGTVSFFDGFIDQVRIFDSALDATAVENLYNEKQAYITKNASDPFGDNSEEAFYKLENNANDSTGSNNGAANNVTFTSGSGLFETYAAGFSGTNYITVTGLTSTSTFSYSLWVKPTNASSSGFKGIFGKQNTEGQLFTDSGVLKIWTTTTQTFTGSPTLSDNVWSHIVLSVSNGTGTIYINGIDKGTSTGISLPSTLYMGTASTQIGVSTYGYQGLIDQVRILDRALDGDEVFKLYAEVIN